MSESILWVVAGALRRKDGQILMQKRPKGKHHAGLWEFPGGKVESAETPVNALIRELTEELGVSIQSNDCRPVAFAEESGEFSEEPIVILLYTVTEWCGDPAALEGGAIDWFEPDCIAGLDKPPLDQELATSLIAQL